MSPPSIVAGAQPPPISEKACTSGSNPTYPEQIQQQDWATSNLKQMKT
jgi:hypothetical protein